MIAERVSKYTVIEEIGRGGMGVVYRAHDPHLRRDVALKVLAPDRTRDPRRQKRFIQEARAASSLNHPGIVTIFDVVRHQGSDVLVMELVAGRSLRSEIQQHGRLPWRRAAELSLQIAEAMVAAHRGGIVHRDLKPENIMLGQDGRLKILDFGLAKLDPVVTPNPDDEAGTWASSLEIDPKAGAGTVAYMAPEQALGEPVGLPSDLFAFGVVFYEMLSGRRPFRGSTALATLQATVFDTPGSIDSGEILPREIPSLIAACLEKRPADRPRDFSTVVATLTRLLRASADLPVAGESNAPTWTWASWPEPRRRWILSVGLLGGLAVVGWTVQRSSERAQPGLPETIEEPAGHKAEASSTTAYSEYLEGRRLLDRYDQPHHIDQAIDGLSRAIDLDDRLAVAYAALSEAFWRRYRVENSDRMWLDRAESHAHRALELDAHLAVSHIALATVAVERDHLRRAEEALDRARVLEPLHPAIPLIRGRAYEKAGKLDDAEIAYQAAIELDPTRREPFDSLGSLLFQQARYEEAEAAFRHSIEVAPDSYIGYRNLAGALQLQGHHDEAASHLQRSLEIRPTWSAYTNLGTLQFFRGFYGEAVSAFEQAIELGANSYITWANLGDAYRFSPVHRAQAPAAFRRAIQLATADLAESSTDDELRSRIALYLAKSGEAEAALLELEEIGLDQADATLLGRAISVFELAGKRSSALQALRRAIDLGYPIEAIERDPELEALRRDSGYHRFLAEL